MEAKPVGIENTSQPTQNLLALTKLRPQSPHNEWVIFAYVLNRDIVDANGQIDDLYGYLFPLDSYSDPKQAEERIKAIIEATGHPAIIVGKYGHPIPLTKTLDSTKTVEVPVDSKGRLIKMEQRENEELRREHERRREIERGILDEIQEERNTESVEYYKRQCYLAIKFRAEFQSLKHRCDEVWSRYEDCRLKIQEHYQRHPDHDQQWLPMLKERLQSRGEGKLYEYLESAYYEMRDELLGLETEATSSD